MRHELKHLAIALLLEKRTLERGYFNERGIRRLLNKFLLGHTDDYLELWRLMMFELWQRNFLAQLQSPGQEHVPDCLVAGKRVE